MAVHITRFDHWSLIVIISALYLINTALCRNLTKYKLFFSTILSEELYFKVKAKSIFPYVLFY